MRIVTFDPGRFASYAQFDTEKPHEMVVGEITQIGSGRLKRPCPHHVREVLDGCDYAVVEEVGARPGQGVSSMFSFGLAVGAIMNAIGACGIGLETCRPPLWKKTSKLNGSIDKDEVKTAARIYAIELWPQLQPQLKIKKNHGMAEAALIARWYLLDGPGRDVPIAGEDADNVVSIRSQIPA